ncbi:MAG: cyclic nucleotide-binding domain-containing protein [Actinomycetes bacterium]
MTIYRSSITSVSWIPSEAIPMSLIKIPIMLGIAHYDPPPPDELTDLEHLHATGRFRFANRLSAWIEVSDGEIVDAGYDGEGLICRTVADLGVGSFAFPPVKYPDLQRDPEFGDGWVRFVQTTGGRTGAPMPRKINRPPFVRVTAPTVWTTLALTIHRDGRSEYEVVGASPFPRHWFYDDSGRLVKKSGIADYRSWAECIEDRLTPWAEREQELLVTDVETQLERSLSASIMQADTKPRVRRLPAGSVLTRQGEEGSELYLILDGMVAVEVNGETVAEVGPGAVLGEMAGLEGGRRTATISAVTDARVAVADAHQIDLDALRQLARARQENDG